MAEGKKSAVIYTDWINIFDELDDVEAGQLVKHLFRYINDKNPEPPNRMIKLVFEPMKLQLKRDLRNWEEIRLKRSESGRKGGLNSGITRKQNEANEANASIVKQNEANEAVTVNVNVNDTVTVIDKKKRKIFIKPSIEEITEYCKERNNSVIPEKFFNHYESKGWVVGKSNMKDWKAAVRTWESNQKETEQHDKLGYNETYINGKRMYNRCIEIPKGTPPCPSNMYHWDAKSKNWAYGN